MPMAQGPVAIGHLTSHHVHRAMVGHSAVVEMARPPPKEVVARRGLIEATLMVRVLLVEVMTPTATALGLTL